VKYEIGEIILTLSKQLPVSAITGPRQSGKTTLTKMLFPEYDYVNLEFPDARAMAIDDPRLLLSNYKKGIIIDEVQRVPELFSYIQGIVDETGELGKYILTGSQNFLLSEQISQSLAGRAAQFNLLPFSVSEISSGFPVTDNFTELAFTGTYPRIYDHHLKPTDWYPWYINSYIERDVRMIENVKDLNKFQIFLKICAGRVGQMFNASAIANEIGVNFKTVQSWLSILETSFIVFLLQPYYKNFNKRLTKSPKIYFYDTGLICSLLGIRSDDELKFHYLKGEIFESLIISEIKKHIINTNSHYSLYFWRDNAGHEIDCILEAGTQTSAIEIKSSATMKNDFFKGLQFWQKLTLCSSDNLNIVYGGLENKKWSKGRAIGWKNVIDLFK
jgi:predicted AAA+ superfamily ATPase